MEKSYLHKTITLTFMKKTNIGNLLNNTKIIKTTQYAKNEEGPE